MFRAVLTLALLFALAPAAHADPRRGEQADARKQLMAGKVRSLREIEGMILPRMRGAQYLGPEYDSEAQVYRLKFIDGNRVRFIDVDATTGAIIAQR